MQVRDVLTAAYQTVSGLSHSKYSLLGGCLAGLSEYAIAGQNEIGHSLGAAAATGVLIEAVRNQHDLFKAALCVSCLILGAQTKNLSDFGFFSEETALKINWYMISFLAGSFGNSCEAFRRHRAIPADFFSIATTFA